MNVPKGEILCIHYYFPPLDSTAVIRNFHISRTLAAYFDKVHVLTSSNHRRFPNLVRPLPENLQCYDISTFDYRILLSGRSKKDAHLSGTKKSSKFSQWLLKVQKSFPFNLFLAEGNVWYIANAYRRAKKLVEAGGIDTIYSSFGPYADHYVAYLLKGKYPHLKWIADFRDLQIEPIYKNVIWKGLQVRVEGRILSRADLVTCISEGFVRQLAPYGRPTRSILRGVRLRSSEPQYDKFTISYTGSLYHEYRDPRPFFKVLRQMIDAGHLDVRKIQLIYAGRDGGVFAGWVAEYCLTDLFVNKGMISQAEAKTIQNRSHINLLLTSSSPDITGVITGKIFEYFEALNPTLCLISGVYDHEFESLFEDLNAGVVVYSPEITSGKMRTFILDKYQEWSSTHRVESTLNQKFIKENLTWEKQVEKMLFD